MPSSSYSIGSSQVMMLVVGRLQRVQGGVERGRLARPRRPRDQDDAVRPADQAVERGVVVRREAELLQAQAGVAAVQDAHDHALAVAGRQRGDAHVHAAPLQPHGDAAVQRQPALGDVHLGHDLDARDGRGQERARHGPDDLQLAVNAVADLEVALARLDVDVRGPPADGVGEQGVDEADDRRLVALAQRLGHVLVLHDVVQACPAGRPARASRSGPPRAPRPGSPGRPAPGRPAARPRSPAAARPGGARRAAPGQWPPRPTGPPSPRAGAPRRSRVLKRQGQQQAAGRQLVGDQRQRERVRRLRRDVHVGHVHLHGARRVMSSSVAQPLPIRTAPSRSPLACCCSSACRSCSWVIAPC